MASFPGIVGAVILSAGLSQFPEFSQQYQQRLGGAVDELSIITAEFDRTAQQSGLTREAALSEYTVANSQFLETRGESMTEVFVRKERLENDLAALKDATPYERFGLISRLTDTRILERTWDNYKPAVPLTAEGLVFTGAGWITGYAIFAGLFGVLGMFRSRRRA